MRILQEASSGQMTQAQVCKDHGVSVNTFYLWKRKYAGLQTDDLRHLLDPKKRTRSSSCC